MKGNVAFVVVGFVLGVVGVAAGLWAFPQWNLSPRPSQAAGGNPAVAPLPQPPPGAIDRLQSAIDQAIHPSPEARHSALQSDLQTLRSQLELYKIQHIDKWPSQIASVGTDGDKFIRQLTGKTTQTGEEMDPGRTLGPYLQRWPANPFVEGAKASKLKIGTGSCPGDNTTGWYFDTSAGKLSANDSEHKGL